MTSENTAPSVSIIVPVYNAEKYLARCVESALAQSFHDFELILVDDGSSDKSGGICDRFASLDLRVHVVHKENGGVSCARNAGMKAARGEFIAFLDSDDYFNPDFLEKLHNGLKSSGCRSAGCGHWNLGADGVRVYECGAMSTGVYNAAELRSGIVRRLLEERVGSPGEILNGFVWRFIFDRAVIESNSITFSGSYLEDELFLIEYFSCAPDLYMLDEPLYNYYKNPESATRKFLPDYVETFHASLERKRALIARCGIEVKAGWEINTLWAGLFIAVGNEYAHGSPLSSKEKTERVRELSQGGLFGPAVKAGCPPGASGNKRIAAFLIKHGLFSVLTMLYSYKNRP